MENSEKLQQFLRQYETYVHKVLAPTREELKSLFTSWKDPTYWATHADRTRMPSPSPIHRAFPRIKRPESVVDKIFRKPSSFPDGVSLESAKAMSDAVAGRIVVYFLSALPIIDREIRESEYLEISKKDPPVSYLGEDLTNRLGLQHIQRKKKDSGYSSIHYVVRLRDSVVPFESKPWVEIQVRTLAEDLWGEIEHVLGYKPEKRTSFAVRKTFQILSLQLAAIDEHFNLLYEELSRFQVEVNYADNHPLNAENLPPVLNELGIGCAQREIDSLLKLLSSRGFKTIKDLRDGGLPRRIELIRNTFRSVEGQEPGNFDIVAGIAATRGLDEKDMAPAIQAQIAFLNTWVKIKKEIS